MILAALVGLVAGGSDDDDAVESAASLAATTVNCSATTNTLSTQGPAGTTFVATKPLLRDYDALQIMLMRFFLAWVLLLLLTRRIEKPVSLKEEAGIFALSLSGVSLYYFFENTALTYTLASNVSIILAAAPSFTSVPAHIFTKDETLKGRIWS